MNWVGGVWLTASLIAGAVMALSSGVFDASWYAFAVGPPVFVAVSVAMPLILGIRDRQKEAKEKTVLRARRNPAPYRR